MKPIMRPPEVAKEVGGKLMYLRMRKAGWIKPLEERKRLTTYSGFDVQKAAARYVSNPKELP